jgi:hypothetical protein
MLGRRHSLDVATKAVLKAFNEANRYIAAGPLTGRQAARARTTGWSTIVWHWSKTVARNGARGSKTQNRPRLVTNWRVAVSSRLISHGGS